MKTENKCKAVRAVVYRCTTSNDDCSRAYDVNSFGHCVMRANGLCYSDEAQAEALAELEKDNEN